MRLVHFSILIAIISVGQCYSLRDSTATYSTGDVVYGSVYAITSGVGLGSHESKNFGYKWETLPRIFKGWYERDTRGDGIFAKSFDFNKVFRAVDNIADRQAYKRLLLFYGDTWYGELFAYLHLFILKNTMASIIRSWAKYDKPFYDFQNWEFDIESIFNRLFINR